MTIFIVIFELLVGLSRPPVFEEPTAAKLINNSIYGPLLGYRTDDSLGEVNKEGNSGQKGL